MVKKTEFGIIKCTENKFLVSIEHKSLPEFKSGVRFDDHASSKMKKSTSLSCISSEYECELTVENAA